MAMRVDEEKQKEKIKIQMSDFLKKYKRRPTKEEFYSKLEWQQKFRQFF